MDVKLVVSVLSMLALLAPRVEADFLYNPPTPNAEQMKARGLKCIPGRTVIQIGQDKDEQMDDSQETRRTHMNANTKDESCKICVCSTEGRDMYCSKRPARNVNECIRMSLLKKRMQNSMPFEHERSLSFRVRRDYIWHTDEIPYDAKAPCKRSTSYYSNSINANNTDIDVASDIDSLLDYANKDVCYFCVCSVDGKQAGCISRDPWFCEYYRFIRSPSAAKYQYHKLFQQDRPAYFRQISYRLRRTMDDSIVSFYESVGEDTFNNNSCVPFISEYSDCTEANYCTGCNRCKCSESGRWQCEEVYKCPLADDEPSDENTMVRAIDDLQSYVEMKKKQQKPRRIFVPPPPNDEDDLIVPENNPYEENFETWYSRQKRSVKQNFGEKSNENTTVKFFHTVDEINEDTLKYSNKTGTIEAQKVPANQIPKISRRTDLIDNFNKSTQSALHIEYNQPQDYDHHIAENKIDAASHTTKLDENELQKLIGNYSQNKKDKDLSKLIVNELKVGDEIIGDKNVKPTSNITFTPANDTLTAMAYIAGNLLSKLWDMEKDAGEDSIETEVLKHEKINDLLDLFKEPLSIRQEIFLKNALEKISDSLNKNKSVKNVSICATLTGSDIYHASDETGVKHYKSEVNYNKTKCELSENAKQSKDKENQHNVTLGVVTKLNNVLGLIKKYENVQNNLKDVKHQLLTKQLNEKDFLDIDKKTSFDLFGTLLDKITKLLIPNKSKSKRVTNKMKHSHQFANKSNVNDIYENKFNINLGKINITTKDKLIVDYLSHIESNPHCLFKDDIPHNTDTFNTNNEGNILYNLSEFFKIKSFVDLIKLIHPENASQKTPTSTTEIPNETSSLKSLLRNRVVDEVKKSSDTKNNLKLHLKAIVNDLQQLQKEHGVSNDQSVNIMDALPCIYKILNDTKVLKEQKLQSINITRVTHFENLENLLATLKHEWHANLPMRRNNFIPREIPKSARVWERIINNINSVQKNSRRNLIPRRPKTYEELKDIMDSVELMGNTYKNFAIISVLPPHKRLMLLKTLEADTKQQSNALADIKSYVDMLDNLSLDKHHDIDEFIENVGNNVRLSTKVLENVEKIKQINKKVLSTKTNKHTLNLPTILHGPKDIVEYKNNNIKLSRDQILNQLIMNRVIRYLKSKEVSGADLTDDINYNIGKRILLFIQSGNMNVAKELFRIFIINKQKEDKLSQKKDSAAAVNQSRNRTPSLLDNMNKPLMRFNGPGRGMQVQTLDNYYKQF